MGVDVCGSGCMWVWMYVGVDVCGCGCMWVWMYVGVDVCGCGCMWEWMYVGVKVENLFVFSWRHDILYVNCYGSKQWVCW